MEYTYLDKIASPEDVKKLTDREADTLCFEIRSFLIENVSQKGGHLASNLGVTELTVALHRVFDSPCDHIIFDVGHQSYVHKLLTGRKDSFDTLRAPGGLSGFTSRLESEHDPFGAGHSSTSISAALGFAEADRLNGSDAFTVCVTGDGAYTGGLVHEALNNCHKDLRLVILLNDNTMSISKNNGAFASYLSKLVACEQNYFEQLGLNYVGPVDGNDLREVERALIKAKENNQSTVVHVRTTKGKGYAPAEKSPDGFHSVLCQRSDESSFHTVMGDALTELAGQDNTVTAITAAMGIGTGLNSFSEAYPKRYFDVGIAEGHALTFSAALAASGLKPFVAIYSTFLQRGYDNILHDIALQQLPVRIMIDRASLAVADGATHHGIFDVAFLSGIPNMTIMSPITYGSLKSAVKFASEYNGPIAIRYPNAKESPLVIEKFFKNADYDYHGVRADFNISDSPECVYVTYGSIADTVLRAQQRVLAKGISCGTVLLETLKPYDKTVEQLIPYISGAKRVVFVEEGIKNGGASMILKDKMQTILNKKEVKTVAIDDNFAIPSELCDLYDYLGMSEEKIAGCFIDE